MLIEMISDKSASELLNSAEGDGYRPLGKFWLQEDGVFIGIDNADGYAWTEEFDTKEKCIAWLIGEDED